MKCSVLYKGDSLQLAIYTCQAWEMELNVSPDASFENMQDWKRIWMKAREVSGTKASITNDETFN